MTSTQTSPFCSGMAQTRFYGTVVDAVGSAATENRMTAMTVGSGTQSSGPFGARGEVKQGL